MIRWLAPCVLALAGCSRPSDENAPAPSAPAVAAPSLPAASPAAPPPRPVADEARDLVSAARKLLALHETHAGDCARLDELAREFRAGEGAILRTARAAAYAHVDAHRELGDEFDAALRHVMTVRATCRRAAANGVTKPEKPTSPGGKVAPRASKIGPGPAGPGAPD